MDIIVRAKPSASSNGVEKVTSSEFIVRTTEPPVQGRANRSIIRLLSKYFAVPLSQIEITAGRTGRTKRITIQ